MLEILFIDNETGVVKYAVTDVSRVRYITPSEIGFDAEGRSRSCSFPHTERVEVNHKSNSRLRAALIQGVRRGA